jgi:hypothetical protein
MGVEDKIIGDIEYVIQYLIEVLKKRNQLDLLYKGKHGSTDISKYIYRLYSRLGSPFQTHLLDILDLIVNPDSSSYITKVLSEYKKSLSKAEHVIKECEFANVFKQGGWVGMTIIGNLGGVKRRLYVNCDPAHVHKVMETLMKAHTEHGFFRRCRHCGAYFTTRPGKELPSGKRYAGNKCPNPDCLKERKGIIQLKFSDPDTADITDLVRTDKIVLYLDDDPISLKIAVSVLKKCEGYLNEEVPKFTNKLFKGIGFAREPGEEHKRYVKEHMREIASFGKFMSLVISRYLVAWAVKRRRIPDKNEIREIAKEIYHYKLKERHMYDFGEP